MRAEQHEPMADGDRPGRRAGRRHPRSGPGGNEQGAGQEAVAEIIHQMAPAAQLMLVCVDSEVDLKLAEQDVIAAGAKIVNHSVGWFDTSRSRPIGSRRRSEFAAGRSETGR